MSKPLAQVTDVDALDAHEGTCARLPLTIPPSWAGEPIEVAAPKLLACDWCDGGGCDRCERSGALRAPDDAAARVLRLTLPMRLEDATCVRLPSPFDGIGQLMIELRPGAAASDGVRRVRPARVPAEEHAAPNPSVMVALLLGALVVVSAVVALL